jgi:hypothetical protein
MQAGISADDIIGCNLRKLTQPLSKELMYELNFLRRNDDYSWVDFYTWIEKLCGSDCLPPLASIKVSIGRLEKKRSELSRNKQSDQIECLFREPFFSSMKVDTRERQQFPAVHSNEPVLEQVNSELAQELRSTEEALATEQSKNEDLVEKSSKLSVRNTNKKIKRKLVISSLK